MKSVVHNGNVLWQKNFIRTNKTVQCIFLYINFYTIIKSFFHKTAQTTY